MKIARLGAAGAAARVVDVNRLFVTVHPFVMTGTPTPAPERRPAGVPNDV
jgi:hypothetical protein